MRMIEAVAHRHGFSVHVPVKELSQEQVNTILYGDGGTITLHYQGTGGHDNKGDTASGGVTPTRERRYRETDSDYVRQEIEKYMAENPCPACQGARLKPESLAVTVDGVNIRRVSQMSIVEALDWTERLMAEDSPLTERERTIAQQVLKEIRSRLVFLRDVGVDYLTLDRGTGTLAAVMACEESISGQYLSGRRQIPVPERRRAGSGKAVVIQGARENNLKNINVRIPLAEFVCVAGVSGSGKSTLVDDILSKKAAQLLYGARARPGA